VILRRAGIALVTLLRYGRKLDGTESATGLMTTMARTRFKHLRPDEVAALSRK